MAISKRRIVKKPPPVEYSGSRALILHPDPEGVRRHHIKLYRNQIRSLAKANKSLKDFEEQDVPAFQNWYFLEFAKDHEAIAKLMQRQRELEMIVAATEDYRNLCGGSYFVVYQKIAEAHKAGKLFAMMDELFRPFQDNPSNEKNENHDEPHDDDDENDYDNFTFDDVMQDFFELNDEDGPSSERSTDPTENHVKTLYHKLVRLLHPDLSHNQTQQHRDLWHQLQKAYEWNDIEALEKIYQQLNGNKEAAIDFDLIPIGDILAMKLNLQKKAQYAQQEIRVQKASGYWNFVKRRAQASYLKRLIVQLHEEFEERIYYAQLSIATMEKKIRKWQKPQNQATKKKPKKPNKNRSPKDQKRSTGGFWDEHFS